MAIGSLTVAEDGEVFGHISCWRGEGRRVALASVVRTWNSSPRPVGSHLAVADDGRFAGSVSGGCIEGEVIEAAGQVIDDGAPRMLDFGISNEFAWESGLACGGQIQVFVAPMRFDLLDSLLACRSARSPVLTLTRLRDGQQALVGETVSSGDWLLDTEQADWAKNLLSQESSCLAEWREEACFARFYPVPVRLVIIGAVHLAQVLASMATLAGFDVSVIDPRRAFAMEERFPGVELICDWPGEALQRHPLDRWTAMAALSHDPKLDDPALASALAGNCFYIGALGSSRTHARRVERLADLGLAEPATRIHGPIGLDLGGRGTVEIAIAILAQIVQQRHLRVAP